ncbi:hypothetical protein C8J56DRAFT_889478 [Mycena floridula]|nr:hypothetical protein C8J56DRAFT_889478 [Mycena floridula]
MDAQSQEIGVSAVSALVDSEQAGNNIMGVRREAEKSSKKRKKREKRWGHTSAKNISFENEQVLFMSSSGISNQYLVLESAFCACNKWKYGKADNSFSNQTLLVLLAANERKLSVKRDAFQGYLELAIPRVSTLGTLPSLASQLHTSRGGDTIHFTLCLYDSDDEAEHQLAIAKKLSCEAYKASLAARTLAVNPPSDFYQDLSIQAKRRRNRPVSSAPKIVGPADIELDDDEEVMAPRKRQRHEPPAAGPSSQSSTGSNGVLEL